MFTMTKRRSPISSRISVSFLKGEGLSEFFYFLVQLRQDPFTSGQSNPTREAFSVTDKPEKGKKTSRDPFEGRKPFFF